MLKKELRVEITLAYIVSQVWNAWYLIIVVFLRYKAVIYGIIYEQLLELHAIRYVYIWHHVLLNAYQCRKFIVHFEFLVWVWAQLLDLLNRRRSFLFQRRWFWFQHSLFLLYVLWPYNWLDFRLLHWLLTDATKIGLVAAAIPTILRRPFRSHKWHHLLLSLRVALEPLLHLLHKLTHLLRRWISLVIMIIEIFVIYRYI